jgi:hypothetical protein
MFAENAHAVFEQREKAREELRAMRGIEPQSLRRKWFAWLTPQTAIPAFAAIVLAAVAGYQNTVVIPGLRSPHSFGSAVTLDGETRDAKLTPLPAGEPLEFLIALNGAPLKGQVEAELIDGAGKVARRGLVKAPGLDQPLDVYFPGSLNSGRYTLVVRSAPSGQPGNELARSPFEIIPPGE